MPRAVRRSAMRVRDGRVQKKNNWRLQPDDYRALPQDEIRIDRHRPEHGYRHLVKVEDLRAFLALLPDWDEVAIGLDAIVLASGDDCEGCLGWYAPGVVAICAWEHDLWTWEDERFVNEHEKLLQLLAVERVPLSQSPDLPEFNEDLERMGLRPLAPDGRLELRWSEAQARGFQLLHILPHELGHHHDRITTRAQRHSGRGERYADDYAATVLDRVRPAYVREFGI